MRDKIPILVLSGFLGSGKTTLLNHLLRESQGLKIGVIVNDFGAINIDALLVTYQTDSKLELSNGCICCAVEESGLDEAIDELAHAKSRLDYIIIEASGLAEPRELKFVLQNSKNKYARLDALVAMVDAANFEPTAREHPSLKDQLLLADIVILNKIDLVKPEELQQLRDLLKLINDQMRVIEAEYARIDAKVLLSPDTLSASKPAQPSLAEAAPQDHSQHAHEQYQQVAFKTTNPLDPQRFEAFLAALPPTIYRAKGFVYYGMKGVEQKFELQAVGNRYDLKLQEWQEGETPHTALVFIGKGLDRSELNHTLQGLIDKDPANITESTLVDIFKYRDKGIR